MEYLIYCSLHTPISSEFGQSIVIIAFTLSYDVVFKSSNQEHSSVVYKRMGIEKSKEHRVEKLERDIAGDGKLLSVLQNAFL